MSEELFEITGLDDLENSMDYLLTNYNDQCELALRKVGLSFKKSVIEKTPSGNTKKSPNKKLNRSYVVSRVQGDFTNKWIDIRSKSPHFHLVERGHEIYNKQGEPTGRRTKPIYMMKRTCEEYKEKYPEEMKKMLVKLGDKAKKKSKKAKSDG